MIIEGLKINHYDQGEGEAILFLHGWGSAFDVFRPFLDSMSARFRVLAFDMPGFGRSQEPPAAWAVGDYADFAAAFLKFMGIGRVILMGHSFGGRVIIKLAGRADAPVEIPKIILIDSAGIRPPKTLRQKARQFVYKAVRKIISIKLVENFFPHLLEAWRRKHGSADYLNASEMMRRVLVKTVGEDLSAHLPLIKAPTLLIWGENDTATPLEDGRKMEKLIPGAGLAVLKNAGHYSFIDQPRIFGRVLDSFLNA